MSELFYEQGLTPTQHDTCRLVQAHFAAMAEWGWSPLVPKGRLKTSALWYRTEAEYRVSLAVQTGTANKGRSISRSV